jgi:hypothetical protein
LRALPEISGNALVNCLCRHWDYYVIKQIGHHVRLETVNPRYQRLTVPVREKLKVELLMLVLKNVAAHKRVEINQLLETL